MDVASKAHLRRRQPGRFVVPVLTVLLAATAIGVGGWVAARRVSAAEAGAMVGHAADPEWIPAWALSTGSDAKKPAPSTLALRLVCDSGTPFPGGLNLRAAAKGTHTVQLFRHGKFNHPEVDQQIMSYVVPGVRLVQSGMPELGPLPIDTQYRPAAEVAAMVAPVAWVACITLLDRGRVDHVPVNRYEQGGDGVHRIRSGTLEYFGHTRWKVDVRSAVTGRTRSSTVIDSRDYVPDEVVWWPGEKQPTIQYNDVPYDFVTEYVERVFH